MRLNSELLYEQIAKLGLRRLTIDLDGTVIRAGRKVAWAARGFNPHHPKDPSYYPGRGGVALKSSTLMIRELCWTRCYPGSRSGSGIPPIAAVRSSTWRRSFPTTTIPAGSSLGATRRKCERGSRLYLANLASVIPTVPRLRWR